MIDLRKTEILSKTEIQAKKFILEVINSNINKMSYNDLIVHLNKKKYDWESSIEKLSNQRFLLDKEQEKLNMYIARVKIAKIFIFEYKMNGKQITE